MPPAIIRPAPRKYPGAIPVMSPLADALSISLPNSSGPVMPPTAVPIA